MQAEDIIQQKEWAELNEAEKAIVFELAEDEASFNLLKKMLLVAEEEEVPVLSTHVHERLLQKMESRRAPVLRLRNLYYAAAAVAVICFAVWFLVNDKQHINDTAGVVPKNTPQSVQTIDKKDSVTQAPVVVTTPPVILPARKEHKKDPVRKKTKESLAVNTTVEQNTALLAFISEVY